ncbi:MAG TPA: mechanosensitive ion channel family protein [Steroidobacteraceae bacterium]|jgi:small-conductance mechanosensitive channel|nr:mechanosensitive ion channel family protein [Steroidobacteraceae bacterium]
MNDYFARKIDAVERLFHTNSLTDWLIAGIVAAAVWFALVILRHLVSSRYEKYSVAEQRLPLRLLAYLSGNTRQFLFFALALYAGEECLTLPARVEHGVSSVVSLLILLQVGLWAVRAVKFYLEMKQLERGADQVFAGSLDIINFVTRVLIWSLVILVALDNLGVNITALLAGLGVGGVAVALALQNVLGDLFASLSIALDKPFVVGDSLTIDTLVGKVEHIGIKTTRLRSESGEQIILSNADILKSRVRNYARAQEQRALATLRIAYGTPPDRLAQVPALLEGIVRAQKNARFERCHLKTLGEAGLLFELSYFIQQPAVNSLLDLQHAVNLHILEEFHRIGVEFDYPTQRVLLGRVNAGAGASPEHAQERQEGRDA